MTKGLEKVDIPDGVFVGKWSGYYVTIIYPDAVKLITGKEESSPIRVNEGVRGIDCPCTVKVNNGYIIVE